MPIDCAFYGCSGLKGVYITDLEKWCEISFGNDTTNPLYYAHNLYLNNQPVTNLVIPNTITTIRSYAFENCSGLTSITIPNSVTTIRSSAFAGCSGLTSITIPNSITTIGYSAFEGCSGLTSITIPNSVTRIGDYAFCGCSGLTSITIGISVTSIGSSAFYNCSSLTSITIPDSVTTIGDSAFSGCSSLKTVYYKGDESEWDNISIGFYNGNLTNASRYYYSETEPTLNDDGTAYSGNYWHYAPDGVTPVIWKKEN